MTELVRDRVSTRRPTVFYAVVTVFVVVLVAGIAIVSSSRVSRVAGDARTLHWHDSALGNTEIVMLELGRAVTLAEFQGSGGVTPADVAAAVHRVDSSLDDLQQIVANGEDYAAHASLARFAAPVEAAVASLQSGDVAGARETFEDPATRAFGEASSALAGGQAEAEEAVAGDVGLTSAGWAELALLLVVPLCAAVGCFLVARIRIQSIEERLGRRLDAESRASFAKDLFLARLSYDLRTQLTSIYGFAELVGSGEVNGVEATRETARTIARESATMTRMVDNLLMASQLQSTGLEIEKREVRVDDVIESAVVPFQHAGVNVNAEPTAAMVETDSELLGHVLVNLISNAVQHGGPEIRIHVTVTDEVMDIEVMDNGPGIPDKDLDVVLGVISDESGGLLTDGPGLGLAVAARVATLLDGAIRYQRYGARTYFVITVPAVSGQAEDDDETTSVADMIRVLSS